MDKTFRTKVSNTLTDSFQELSVFLASTEFSRAILVGFAVTLPMIVGIQLGYFEAGLALSFGAFWCSPSDVSGSFRHKKNGILFSAAMVMVVSFIGGYLHYETWLSLPVLGILSFCISFLSIYGFRASLISFSGLLALVLSFAHNSEELEIYQYALLTGAGGLWYLLLAKVWHRINPRAETEEFLAETYKLTAKFLETRGNLVGPQDNRAELQSKLYRLQSALTKKHETLREILILSRRKSGQSHYKGKRLLVFVQLVEMLETAIANPVNYVRMDTLLSKHPEFVASFRSLIFEMARQLRLIAEAGTSIQKLPKITALEACFEKVENEISAFGLVVEEKSYADFLMLRNLLSYQKKQFEKLKRIKWLLGDTEIGSEEFIDRDVSRRFLAAQDYDPKLLVHNLNFRSTLFKHSLRLAATLMVGYTVGNLFAFQNPYWILLTIIVIMRPSYGLTKTRSKDRMIGTLIGGAVAVGMVYLVQDPYAYAVMGVVSLVISFSMIQRNFKASATFVTLSVIFIYAIIEPDVLSVIKFRVLDTLAGAVLSYTAMRWLWPTWEITDIMRNIEKSVSANLHFYLEITGFYRQKGELPTSFSIARKEAFLETSNLSSAFQRMAQEPKSKQIHLDKIFELVELNHNFLASLASLSSYVQHHPTTEASEHFNAAAKRIENRLLSVLQCLRDEKCDMVTASVEDITLFEEDLLSIEALENTEVTLAHNESVRDLLESHLISEHLQWLYSMSGNMLKLAAVLQRS